jgi:uncharacterized protein YggE
MGDNAEHIVTVTGTGIAGASPDIAEVSIGVSATKSSVKDAREAAAAAMRFVIDAVKNAGVPGKDVATTDIHLSPVYDYSNNRQKLTGYEFGNTVRVILRQLDLLSVVIDATAAAGATSVNGIELRVADPSALQSQARKLAMADARAKADELAALAGVTVTGVASIAESVDDQPRPMMFATAMKARSMEATPVEAGTSEVRVTVTVGYLIG